MERLSSWRVWGPPDLDDLNLRDNIFSWFIQYIKFAARASKDYPRNEVEYQVPILHKILKYNLEDCQAPKLRMKYSDSSKLSSLLVPHLQTEYCHTKHTTICICHIFWELLGRGCLCPLSLTQNIQTELSLIPPNCIPPSWESSLHSITRAHHCFGEVHTILPKHGR